MLNRKEILRYIGASAGDDTLNSMIDRAEKEVVAASRPRHIYKHIDIAVNGAEGRVNLAGMEIESRDLVGHLDG